MAGNVTAPMPVLPPPLEINDTHKVYDVTIGCTVMCIVASTAVLGRLYVRFSSRSHGLDDYAFILALFTYLAYSILAIYANLHAGVGKPLWEITIPEYIIWYKILSGTAFLYPAMSTSIRVSILLFYRRLFATPNSNFKKVVDLCLILQVLYLIPFTIVPAFSCRPIYAAWTLELFAESCDIAYYYDITTALYSVSLGFDVVLTVLPLWPIMKLHVATKKKVAIGGLFLGGFSACFAAAYKLYQWQVNLHRTWDGDPQWLNYQMSLAIPPQWRVYGQTFWIPSMVEPTLAMICASLPGLQPAFVKGGKLMSSKFSELVSRSRGSTGVSGKGSSKGSSGVVSGGSGIGSKHMSSRVGYKGPGVYDGYPVYDDNASDAALHARGAYLELNEVGSKSSLEPPGEGSHGR